MSSTDRVAAGAGAQPRHPIFENSKRFGSRTKLSKSKFVTGLQCYRRLWWQVHDRNAPELVLSTAERAVIERGLRVGEVARNYVPGGVLIQVPSTEPERRVAETQAAINSGANVIYEAAFFEDGIFIAADILERGDSGWTLAEVKSSTKVKPEHLPDAAVQAHVLGRAGVNVRRVEIMHLNRDCKFPDLSNLFHREVVTEQIDADVSVVPEQARRQLQMLAGPVPQVSTGEHCRRPYPCPFFKRCNHATPKHHVSTLYRVRRSRVMKLLRAGYQVIDQIPDEISFGIVTERQRRAVRDDRMLIEPGLNQALSHLKAPVAYLDFETVGLAIPIWSGCRPYDAIPAQFSCHVESKTGVLEHHEWIADSADDPREKLALALVDAVRGASSIAAYHSPFERMCIEHLRDNLPVLADELDDVLDRLVDVLPIVRDHVYHPDFLGSFSLKTVYPVLVGDAGYAELDVVDGATASVELERLMFDNSLAECERDHLRASLLKYCAMDTIALKRLVQRLRELPA